MDELYIYSSAQASQLSQGRLFRVPHLNREKQDP